MKITISTTNVSREEVQELMEYLENNCWDFKTDEKKENEVNYLLKESGIHVIGSHGVSINEKIEDEELFEYKIVHRDSLIDDIGRFLGEAMSSDKELMMDDLELLRSLSDDYVFSSISTNNYIYHGHADFDETCQKLINLNEEIV